jgi:hypothetical protein
MGKRAAGWGSMALERVEGRPFYFLFSPFSVFRFSKVLGDFVFFIHG